MTGCMAAMMLALPVNVYADEPSDPSSATICVSANATSYAVPDKARMTIYIEKQNEDASAATDELTVTADKVLEAIKENGVEEKNIQTTGYNLEPDYHYSAFGTYVSDGYTATIRYSLSDLDVESVGAIISEATNAGATEIDNIQYECSDYDDRYQEALKDAVKRAGAKAEAIAEASDYKIIGVESITEGYEDDSARYTAVNYAAASAADSDAEGMRSASPMQISAGQTQIDASVTVTYQIAKD